MSSHRLNDPLNSTKSTIHCLPRGVCSWDFDLQGDGHRGTLEFQGLGEQGVVIADGVPFQVRKQGMFSGRWTLEHDDAEVASAHKPSAFTRSFMIDDPSGPTVLRAESAFKRAFHLERGEQRIATISADHAFTRRSKIEILTSDWDSPIVFFSFWLVVLIWRRDAQNSG